ncbi:PilC/PilY family type IV pilus protein [Acidovorax sp.]|uniref:pilus assembly protein n=1 Tax=Acidovorax sp. TaxID=1872122 RepID=UPI00262182FC|nr:PilC/PilY family type IV pilus protein [Acidovorax sp.]
MRINHNFQKTTIAVIIGTIGFPQIGLAGDFLNLVQYPAGSASREPAPNIIVSVDNSGSMGVTGITALKDALKETFRPANVPDDSIRLAYQSLWGCNAIPSAHASCNSKNSMKALRGLDDPTDDSHRGNFIKWVNTLVAGGNTPTHRMQGVAGEYLKTTGIDNPYNFDPGTTEAPIHTCRRSYNILMTDGGWNNNPANTINNDDGVNHVFPDGTSYDVTAPETRIYRDDWGTARVSTLSDMAFYYWRHDLQSGISNQVVPLIKKSGSETFADGATTATIPQYWNPKNNPANWQHMVTYTIGYNGAAAWPDIATNPMFNVAQGMYGGDFSRAIVGTRFWRDPLTTNETGRQEELWHTAINSRGKFYPAQTSQDLVDAFKDIVGTIIADSTRPITGFSSSSSSISNQGTTAFFSTYEADGWIGGIGSKTVAAATGALSDNAAWGTTSTLPARGKTTGDKLDELSATDISSRLILTYNDTTAAGTTFTWNNLSTTQKNLLNTVDAVVDTLGQDRLNYIRGDRTKEGTTVTEPFRVRRSRQGDIANSTLWYVGPPNNGLSADGYRTFANAQRYRMPMLYVGGNDGMLHGFSAADGVEKISYIPQGVINSLSQLSKQNYSHRYFVDGSPFTGDVNTGTSALPSWKTMLVGTLGAGGKGYYVLDVTRPGYTGGSETSNFLAGNASSLVVMDKTDGTDSDIGNIFGDPVTSEANSQIATQITRMNNGRWAVVLGNGYNSSSEDPVLLIQYLDGDKSIKKINAASTGTESSANGLSTPRLLDVNGDGTVDMIYAGDLRGNIWKFDVSNVDSNNWKVAFSSAGCTACTPFYTAVEKANTANRQPITAAPNLKPNNIIGGMMVVFGTGRNVTESDRTDVTVQTLYSILDNTRYKLDTIAGPNMGKVLIDTSTVTPTVIGTNGRDTTLAERVFGTSVIAGQGVNSTESFWRMPTTQAALNYTLAGTQKGWYFELPIAGERILSIPTFYDGSDVIDLLSIVPASGGNTSGETCQPTSTPTRGYRTFLGVQFGLKPTQQILDANGDGLYQAAAAQDNDTNRTTTSPHGISLKGKGDIIKLGIPPAKTKQLAKPTSAINWRQLQ